ncbi:MAG: BamA/TamA family outer membrane protein [Capnocytophaga sp.]|nr:BamA/TamA family outer membrane protein [Capnocytophaga sp.]
MKFFTKIIGLFAIVSLVGCNITKRVPDNAFLLRQNTILENGQAPKNKDLKEYLRQDPNARTLGIPIPLFIYNLASENSEKNYHKWLEKHPKMNNFLEALLSKKQVNRLGESFIIAGKDKMLQNIGESPVILDTALTRKSAQILKAYYQSNGFFNAESHYTISPVPNKKKQAEVTYSISTGKPYFIDSLAYSIASPELDSVYKAHLSGQKIKKGEQYSLTKFSDERNRLNTIFRNQGFYNFQQSAITFDIQRDTISQNKDSLIIVQTKIDNYTDRSGETSKKRPYLIHKLNRIYLYTDYDFSGGNSTYDSITYKDLTIFYKGKQRFRLQTLYDAIALRKDDIYKDDNRSATYRQINNLRAFKYPNIQFVYDPKDKEERNLNANIFLSPLSKFALETNTELTHSGIQAFGIGLNGSFLARNVFRGAETLEIIPGITLGSQKFLTNSEQFFNVFEYRGDVRLTIPRIWFFGNIDNLIPYSKTPQTIFQAGTSIQKNIGLDREKLNAVLRYSWSPNITNRSIFEFMDVEFIRNMNPDNFFEVYQTSYQYLNEIARAHSFASTYLDNSGNLNRTPSVISTFILDAIGNANNLTASERLRILNVLENYERLTKNNLIFATSYTYLSNNSIRYFEDNYEQFRLKLETAGNVPQLISTISKMNTDENGQRQFFGVTYAQYAKIELEYIKHWRMGRDKVLAWRVFSGWALPYGNGKNIPFSRSFFAGGSNDNRGWKAYSLGPGKGNSLLEFNEANFKFTTNLEYRFPIAGSLKGAVFADAGNIWHLMDDVTQSDWMLDKLEDFQDIALATGFGVRYDFNYFVLRFDFGLKTYNPAESYGNRWKTHLKFSDFVINLGINYPF